MRTHRHTPPRAWAFAVLCLAFMAPAAWADRPDEAGQGKHRRQQEQSTRGHDSEASRDSHESREPREVRQGAYFEPRHHEAVREMYGAQMRQGRCPPGLAKKGNGCLPPGQAKRWSMGQPLPTGMTLYPVPLELRQRLGPPPPGYKYVRAASDILLIAIGTSMVVDAIEDLGGL